MLRMSSTPNTPIGSRRKADTVYVSNNNNNNQNSVARPGTSKRPLNNNNQKSDTRRVKTTKNAINTIYPNIRKPVNGKRGVVAQRTRIPPNFSKKVPDLKPAKNKKPPKQRTTKKPTTVTQPSTKSKNLSKVLLSRINNFLKLLI